MSKEHSCYSSSCSARRKQNGTCSPICYCGESCVVRTAKTTKNRGKQFWECSKYKNGGEESGCNFFKWCNDIGGDERGSFFNSEGNKETLMNSEDMDSIRKMILNLEKSVFNVQQSLKVLMLLVCVICVILIVIVSMLMRKG